MNKKKAKPTICNNPAYVASEIGPPETTNVAAEIQQPALDRFSDYYYEPESDGEYDECKPEDECSSVQYAEVAQDTRVDSGATDQVPITMEVIEVTTSFA